MKIRILIMAVLVTVAVCVQGCISVHSKARTLTDGTKELEQTVRATAGATIQKGMLDFSAQAKSVDGSNWNVTSGTRVADVATPDMLPELIDAAISAYMKAAGIYQPPVLLPSPGLLP